MFAQMLAIDVDSRIPNFLTRVAQVTEHAPLAFAHAHDVKLTNVQRESIDAMVVSIYQDVSENLINQLPSLKYVGVLGTSLKKIPQNLCEARGITVRNVTEYCDEETAEWVLLQSMKFFRDRSEPLSVRDKTLGVVGVGAVGRHVIELARALQMKVFYNATNPHPHLESEGVQWLTKDKLFASCDVISCHTPPFLAWLTKETLEQAKTNLCLVNTCMGKISAENSLEEFLHARTDVTFIMDSIAAMSYESLKSRAPMCTETAYVTRDVKERLISFFFDHQKEFLTNR